MEEASASRPRRPMPEFGWLLWRYLRVVLVAGAAVGVVIAGVGSRLAMLLLRVTSGERVRGVTSDDGFEIGRFSFSASYGLVQFGALAGGLGATLYLLVRPWLIGPRRFRHLTVGLGCAAVVGSMLLHADGVDFALLRPRWLAMALFIAIPALFGLLIGPMVELVERRPLPRGWRQFVAPAVAVAVGPGVVASLFIVVPVLFIFAGARVTASDRRPLPPAATWAIRGAWLVVALLGLNALLNDIAAISALPG